MKLALALTHPYPTTKKTEVFRHGFLHFLSLPSRKIAISYTHPFLFFTISSSDVCFLSVKANSFRCASYSIQLSFPPIFSSIKSIYSFLIFNIFLFLGSFPPGYEYIQMFTTSLKPSVDPEYPSNYPISLIVCTAKALEIILYLQHVPQIWPLLTTSVIPLVQARIISLLKYWHTLLNSLPASNSCLSRIYSPQNSHNDFFQNISQALSIFHSKPMAEAIYGVLFIHTRFLIFK